MYSLYSLLEVTVHQHRWTVRYIARKKLYTFTTEDIESWKIIRKYKDKDILEISVKNIDIKINIHEHLIHDFSFLIALCEKEMMEKKIED